MAASQELDLRDKTVWKDRPDVIANKLGFVFNQECERALREFYNDTVDPATVMELMSSVAFGFLKAHTPPLTIFRE